MSFIEMMEQLALAVAREEMGLQHLFAKVVARLADVAVGLEDEVYLAQDRAYVLDALRLLESECKWEATEGPAVAAVDYLLKMPAWRSADEAPHRCATDFSWLESYEVTQ